MRFILFCLIFSLCGASVVEARRIALVGPASERLLATLQAAVQDVYSSNTINNTVSPVPEVFSVWLNGTASNRLAAAQAAAADSDLFLAVVTDDDASIASVFANAGVRIYFLLILFSD